MSNLRTLNVLDVMLGRVEDLKFVTIFGRNNDIDTGSTPECIWNGGGRYEGFNATAAETLDVNSTSASDTSLQIELHGLDASYNEISEIVTLNAGDATIPVTTVNSYIRCSFAHVISPATATNVGDIEAFQTTSSHKMFDMPAGKNNTHIAVYTVPANKRAYLKTVDFSLARSSGTSASVDIFVRLPGEPFRSRLPGAVSQGGGPLTLDGDGPTIQNFGEDLFFPAQTDIEMVVTDVSANNTIVTGFARILVEDI